MIKSDPLYDKFDVIKYEPCHITIQKIYGIDKFRFSNIIVNH